MPKSNNPTRDFSFSFFAQCREAFTERKNRYQERVDSAKSMDELNKIKQDAPSVYDTPECNAFYPTDSELSSTTSNDNDEPSVETPPDKSVDAVVAQNEPEDEKEDITSDLDRDKDIYGL